MNADKRLAKNKMSANKLKENATILAGYVPTAKVRIPKNECRAAGHGTHMPVTAYFFAHFTLKLKALLTIKMETMNKFVRKYRPVFLTWAIHKMALPFIRLIVTIEQFPYTMAELRQMSRDSLAAALIRFWEQNGLDLLAEYEGHDIKHALLGYPANEEGEVCLQYFLLGNGYRTFPVLISVVITFFIMPDYYGAMWRAYRRGRQTPRFHGNDLFQRIALPMDVVLRELRVAPM